MTILKFVKTSYKLQITYYHIKFVRGFDEIKKFNGQVALVGGFVEVSS